MATLKHAVTLDGISLTCRDLSRLGGRGSTITICDEAMKRVVKAREVVDKLVERGFSEGHVAYGVRLRSYPTAEIEPS
jgi:histidine ammonia-lyase